MSHSYVFQIDKLKNSFENIIKIKAEIKKMKEGVTQKLSDLKNLHGQMIKDNNKQIFLFCLDSFFYQFKIFSLEFEHFKKLRSILNNRMYCDYYKLHNIIAAFCKQHINEENLELQSFPPYKDLEPFYEYRVEDIKLLHQSILNLVNLLHNESANKEYSISHYNENHKVGFSISNFLNTLSHENRVLQDQIALFINYLAFFHISQQKQLKKLHHRISDFSKEVSENINMNCTFSIDDIQEDNNLDMFDDVINPVTDNELIYDNIQEGNNSMSPQVMAELNHEESSNNELQNKDDLTEETLNTFKSLS